MHFYSCIFVHLWMVVAFLVLPLPPASLLVVWVKEKYKRSSLIIVLSSLTTIWHLSRRCRVKTVKLFRGSYSRQSQRTPPICYSAATLQDVVLPSQWDKLNCVFCFTIEIMKAPEKQPTQKPYVNHTLEFHLHLSRSSFNFLFSHAYPEH